MPAFLRESVHSFNLVFDRVATSAIAPEPRFHQVLLSEQMAYIHCSKHFWLATTFCGQPEKHLRRKRKNEGGFT